MEKTMTMAEYVNFLAYMRKNHPEILDKIKRENEHDNKK
jgi:uncharacterized short protein YbdD (DUF466 family)